MRGVTVCVEFDDLLAVTLPYNKHHFDEFLVITTTTDYATHAVAKRHGVGIFMTDAFYERHAVFNKWLALEQGLTSFGRHGLMVLLDVDVLWPKNVEHENYHKGFLYTPRRRVCYELQEEPPPEDLWSAFPVYGDREWAGYTQIFHADDPCLPEPPWHETNWIHAGGADSFFQNLWPQSLKRRPNWDCLHLGIPGRNWCGRTSQRTDGRLSKESEERRKTLNQIMALRRIHRGYLHEKLPEQPGG